VKQQVVCWWESDEWWDTESRLLLQYSHPFSSANCQ
jgi:hypothetical protein